VITVITYKSYNYSTNLNEFGGCRFQLQLPVH